MTSDVRRREDAVVSTRRVDKNWILLWHLFFYGELAIVTVATVWLEALGWREAIVACMLAMLLGGWYGLCMGNNYSYLRKHPLITQGYLVIGWGIWLALTNSHSLYWLMLFTLCPQLYIFSRGWWKIPGICFLTSLAVWKLMEGTEDYSVMLIFLGLIPSGFFLSLHMDTMHRQNGEKDVLLRELEATRQELAAAERQAGAAQERQRLAHEIHDTLAQGFTSIIMHVEAAEGALHSDMDSIERHLSQVRQTARENLVEARRLMWALQPEALERASLPEVLTRLVQKWSEESAVSGCTIITGSKPVLRPEIEVTLLRAAQEALANVRKHAGARHVTVTLTYMDDMVMLDVQDDGIGFDPTQITVSPNEHTSGGFGLKTLRERVEQSGGSLSIESIPAEGTTLAVALPALLASSYECARQQAPAIEKELT